MDETLPLDQMTVDEKLRALERIWDDLSREDGNVPYPPWHGDALKARQARVDSGDEHVVDWHSVVRRGVGDEDNPESKGP